MRLRNHHIQHFLFRNRYLPNLSYIEQQKGDDWINTLSISLIFVCSVPFPPMCLHLHLLILRTYLFILVGNILVASVWICVLSLWLRTRRLLSPDKYWLFLNSGANQWRAIGEKVKIRCDNEGVCRWKRQKQRNKNKMQIMHMKQLMTLTHKN